MRALTPLPPKALLPVLVLIVGLGLAMPVWADSDPESGADDAPGAAYCAAVARDCGASCADSTEPGSAAAAACQARCAIERAACDTRDSLSGVEPWLSEKADRMDRFMDGFRSPDDEDGSDGGSDGGAMAEASCAARHDSCEMRCEIRHDDDAYGRAGCESKCAIDRATCEAGAGVETARPFIEREAERLQDFFGGFLEDDEAAPPPPPAWGEPNPDGTMDL
ncbi:hypothetical protein [Roseospira navarrensis]|uniref:Uncharacterized protein n=1 Tax=Roseospira navarrensis TaxID=140058 RepID=A0A7X2D4V9_9PROT|nr:hypothetical protein [Roseospira navarrensis]MQX37027.1 hypothetical protein [Roseospira navarrensis]